MEDICNYSKKALEDAVNRMREPRYRAHQIFRWLYQKGAPSFEAMTNLSAAFRKKLSNDFYVGAITLLEKKISTLDGTAKYLFGLADGSAIETAYIPEARRATVCVSSQVGCRYGCLFCASRLAGFVRHLTVSEIVNQLIFIRHTLRHPVINIVFMGIGEPFDNYDNVVSAIRIFNDKDAFGIGARRITVSTCGIIPRIRKFQKEGFQVELSVSLHAAENEIRSRLLPVNKAYPLQALMQACNEYTKKTKRIVTFEYVLIKTLNSSGDDARALCRLLAGIHCKVNIIAYNRTGRGAFAPPDKKTAARFIRILKDAGITATLRASRGDDIDAGCGQLRIAARQ